MPSPPSVPPLDYAPPSSGTRASSSARPLGWRPLLIVLLVAALMVLVVQRSMSRKYTPSRRSVTLSRLNQLAAALRHYTAANGGRYPAGLANLVPAALPDRPETMRCAVCDRPFRYFGRGASAAARPAFPVLVDHAHGQPAWALVSDGRVTVAAESEVAAMLDPPRTRPAAGHGRAE